MRCVACNCVLTDREASRKGIHSNQYLDLCNSCIQDTDIDYVENVDLDDQLYEEGMIEDFENENEQS